MGLFFFMFSEILWLQYHLNKLTITFPFVDSCSWSVLVRVYFTTTCFSFLIFFVCFFFDFRFHLNFVFFSVFFVSFDSEFRNICLHCVLQALFSLNFLLICVLLILHSISIVFIWLVSYS